VTKIIDDYSETQLRKKQKNKLPHT